ncbi:hypothetical protein NX059_011576 [Plenodomus lindquistii]|nr:hypothetical protein NX059_011576 [Plenodomus lindquistii]
MSAEGAGLSKDSIALIKKWQADWPDKEEKEEPPKRFLNKRLLHKTHKKCTIAGQEAEFTFSKKGGFPNYHNKPDKIPEEEVLDEDEIMTEEVNNANEDASAVDGEGGEVDEE